MFKRLTNRLWAIMIVFAVVLALPTLGVGATSLDGPYPGRSADHTSAHRRSRKTHRPAKKTKHHAKRKHHKKTRRHRVRKKMTVKPPRVLKFPGVPLPAGVPGASLSTSGVSSSPSATVAPGVSIAPVVPAIVSVPVVSGSTAVGQTLSATAGTWAGAPTGYVYQWQRDGGTSIVGATSSSYKVLAGDVGHTLDVVVTATNAAGNASAASAQTATVAVTGALQTGCFPDPSACGYPDPTNTGVPADTSLEARSGKIVVTQPDTTIKDLKLTGEIVVEADNTTIEDDEVIIDGSQKDCDEPCNGHGIQVEGGASGTVVKHVTCHGGSPEGENASEFCMKNYSDVSVNVSYMDDYNVGACWWGEGIYENNYCFVNAVIPEEHYEAIYYGGGHELKMNHNTMFSNKDQTAIVFASVDFHNQETISLTNNFMAGGGFMIYGGGSGNGGEVIGPVTIADNRFARCLTAEVESAENGHDLCKDGPDSHGYFPNGGSYGITSYMTEAVTTYSGNYWDDNLEPVL